MAKASNVIAATRLHRVFDITYSLSTVEQDWMDAVQDAGGDCPAVKTEVELGLIAGTMGYTSEKTDADACRAEVREQAAKARARKQRRANLTDAQMGDTFRSVAEDKACAAAKQRYGRMLKQFGFVSTGKGAGNKNAGKGKGKGKGKPVATPAATPAIQTVPDHSVPLNSPALQIPRAVNVQEAKDAALVLAALVEKFATTNAAQLQGGLFSVVTDFVANIRKLAKPAEAAKVTIKVKAPAKAPAKAKAKA